MGWLGLFRLLSVLVVILAGRIAEREKDVEIVLQRQQLESSSVDNTGRQG